MIHTYESVADLDLARWDALFGRGSFFSSSGWLRHAERTAHPAPVYSIVEEDGDYLGGLAGYPLDASSPFAFCRTDTVLADALARAGREPPAWLADLMPTLACGGRNPGHTRVGLATHPNGPSVQLSALVDAAEATARRRDLRSVSFLYVDEDDGALRECLTAAGYAELASEEAFTLDVPAGGLPEYHARFDQRRSCAIKREIRALDEARVFYRDGALDPALIDRLVPLELALYDRHGTTADGRTLTDVLASIAMSMPDQARVVIAELAGQICGFVLTLSLADERFVRQAGFDYAAKGRLPVYFGLVYYEQIRRAAAAGIRRLYYGTGSPAAKRSRGCRAVGQFAYVKALDAGLHRSFSALVAGLAG